MYKDGKLTISEWYKGQKNHPIYGFGLLKNVEVFENKGIVKLKNRAILRDITVTQLPIAEVYDDYGNTYTATGETGQGTVYKNGTSIQGSLSNLRDIKIYKDYLFTRYGEFLAMYGPLSSGSAQWFGGYSGFDTSYNAQMVVGQDDYLYITNGNYIAKIEVTASGTPAVQPTLTVTQNALDLPDGQYGTCITEYGTNLVIGTQGGGSYFERGNYANARLYSWNRQAGTLGNPGLADLPVVFNENGINAILQHANKLYVSAGTQGNIYQTDATNYIKLTTLPFTKTGFNGYSTVYTNAMDISAKGTLLVGVSCDQDENFRPGIYEVDITDSSYPVAYRAVTSTAGITGKIGFVSATSGSNINVGWADGSTYGVDYSDSEPFSSYGGVIETPLIRVGAYNSKKTFEHIEFVLANPLVSGQNIRISYRKNAKEAYTTLNTWGYSTLGSVISFQDIAGIADCEYVQLKIELDQDNLTPETENIYLITVTLW